MKKFFLFLGVFFIFVLACWHLFYGKQFYLINAEDKRIYRSLAGLVETLNDVEKSKIPFSEKVDFYAGNFNDKGIPEIKNKNHVNVLWLGSYMTIDFEALKTYDYIFVSTKDLYFFLQKQKINSYFLPMFVYDDKREVHRKCTADETCYWVVIGDMFDFKHYLDKHHIVYKSYNNADEKVVGEIYDDFEHILGIAADNNLYGTDTLDVSPLYFEAALQDIPVIVYKKVNQHNLAALYFDDTIQGYSITESIPALFDNIKDTAGAKALVKKFYTQEAAKERVLSAFGDRLFVSPTIDNAITVWTMSQSLETYSGDLALAQDFAKSLKHFFDYSFVTFPASILKSIGDVNVFLRGVPSFSKKDILPNRLSVLYLIYPSVNKFETDNFQINMDDYIASVKDEFSLFDGVVAASEDVMQALNEAGIKAYFLPQFTNQHKFYNEPKEELRSEVLFIGTNYFNRPSVPTLLKNGIKVDIYGPHWNGLAKAPFVDNKSLRYYYSSAKIVLNDTRPDMKQLNFISNRVFDATACGALVISDYIPAIEKYYGDSVPMWKTPEELVALVKYYLDPAHETERLEKAERAREITLKNFTSEIAAEKFYNIIEEIKAKKNAH